MIIAAQSRNNDHRILFQTLLTMLSPAWIASGAIVLGMMAMCICSSIFGLQILTDICKVENKTPSSEPSGSDDPKFDPNYGWKAGFFATSGVGWSPVALLAVWLLLQITCGSNRMIMSGVLSAIIGGGAIAVAAASQYAANIQEVLGGGMAGLLVLMLTLGIQQPSTPMEWLIRFGIVGIIFCGSLVVMDTAAIVKYGACQKERGCASATPTAAAAPCDNTCTPRPTAAPCGACGECADHNGVLGKMWAVNGCAIVGFLASIGAVVAGAM